MEKQLDAECWCPKCRTLYGQIYRVRINHDTWRNEAVGSMPKYCALCEVPVERKR